MAGSKSDLKCQPLWLLAELTYRCPLQCPYCSNPVDIARYTDELTTDEWVRVLREARSLGATQLGLSGGEPLVRQDLEKLIHEAHQLGYYSNLITSGLGMDEKRVMQFKKAGLDHIQISFQASEAELNNHLGGTNSFRHKLDMARAIKAHGYPMVLNVVIHRLNIDRIEEILCMAIDLNADYVELASTQYYGWAELNLETLLPTRPQLQRAEKIANKYQKNMKGKMKILYVVPDYYEARPKACMNGWGSVFLTIAPDGTALPCHAAAQLPDFEFPNIRKNTVEWIWSESESFNRFRGYDWMQEPCRSCPEKTKDFGGCRCQAYMLTGDATAADPVCDKSPNHRTLTARVERIARTTTAKSSRELPLIFRNMNNSR